MNKNQRWTRFELVLVLATISFMLVLHGALPFLMVPGQIVWTSGFSLSFTHSSIFNIYALDIGIPKPAAIAYGLAGAWPESLLIRLGFPPIDAYSGMVALWLLVAFISAFNISRRFEVSRPLSLLGSLTWISMPIIWWHAMGYSMLALGFSLLSFYFWAALNLLNFDGKSKSIISASILYFVATIVAVFMDGYTFMMFATGSTILILYSLVIRPDLRKKLLQLILPIHIMAFFVAYLLYALFIGKTQFQPHPIDAFRGWGLDLLYTLVPTKGTHWLPDLLGFSVKRSDAQYFGDASVWSSTFALPVILFGILAWFQIRKKEKIATGLMLVAICGFYMALGPSVKINTLKPESLQLSHPGQASALMPAELAIAPTGNAWISEKIPGFNEMRASYRWSGLGIISLWLIIMLWARRSDTRFSKLSITLILILIAIFNLPASDRLKAYSAIRNNIHQIDHDLVFLLSQHIKQKETVAFLPWGNDFLANYLAPKVGFKTYNIGGDKNLQEAEKQWPLEMMSFGWSIPAEKIFDIESLLMQGKVDVVVIPYFDMRKAQWKWPCSTSTNEGKDSCPDQLKNKYASVLNTLKESPYLKISDTQFFATVRLPEKHAKFLKTLMTYPINVNARLKQAGLLLSQGWYSLEETGVWSGSKSKLTLPIPNECQKKYCAAVLNLMGLDVSQKRSVSVRFDIQDPSAYWSKEVILSEGLNKISIPLISRNNAQNISISIPNAASPKELQKGDDSRVLGIALTRIDLDTNWTLLNNSNYPFTVNSRLKQAESILNQGWYSPEEKSVWSSAKSKLSLPIPDKCLNKECTAVLTFFGYGSSPQRPLSVHFNAEGLSQPWSKEIILTNEDNTQVTIPLNGANRIQEVDISIPDAISPKKLTGAEDDRILGIGLLKIDVDRVTSN